MFARDSCISTGVLWMWHSDSDYVHFCPLAFGRRSFNHFWSSESDPMSAVGLAIVSLFLLLFSTLLGWTVDWVRNVDDASLKYCDRSQFGAPAAAVHAIQSQRRATQFQLTVSRSRHVSRLTLW